MEKIQKNPGIAAVLSFLFIGLGQIYNGKFLSALSYVLVEIIILILAFNTFGEPQILGFIINIIVWVICIVDSYNSAESINSKL